MKRMFAERIRVNLRGNIASGGITYSGIIENVSEDGRECLISSSIKIPKDFAPQKTVQLNLDTPSKGSFNLTCDVIWFLRPKTHDQTLIFGAQILDPPPQYVEFVENLHMIDANQNVL